MPTRPSPEDADTSYQELAYWFLRRQNLLQWSPQDEHAFQQWLTANPANRDAYIQWELDWQLMDQMPTDAMARLRAQVASDRAIANAAVGETAALLEAETPTAPAMLGLTARRNFFRRTLHAMVAGSVLASVGWLGWSVWQVQPLYEQHFQTQRGQSQITELPDGSILELDTHTKLQATFYRDRREILLHKGQVFFAVGKDVKRPFLITADDVRITVTGTRFTVRYTPGLQGLEAVTVAVEEGSVRVHKGVRNAQGEWMEQMDGATYQLQAGEKIAIGPGMVAPEVATVAVGEFSDWRQQRISFRNAPLQQALLELGRYADTGIISMDPGAAQLRLSGTFNPHEPEAVRRLLTGALPVRLHSQGAGQYHLALR